VMVGLWKSKRGEEGGWIEIVILFPSIMFPISECGYS
jgi:hypothetical protein